ncbi:MAG: BCCT family transporter, partial [Leptospiraceae bacterium]|nr:BCCT family transporter [Leptospiraceae bacterium]
MKIFNRFGLHLNPYVSALSAALIFLFVFLGVMFTEAMKSYFAAIQDFISYNLGWFYILCVGFYVIFVVWLYFSPYGRIRLGPDDEKPKFSYMSWFAMLFSAGMGIGLVFYSVAEPMTHYMKPPVGVPRTIDAAQNAMVLTYFHWGLHAWAIYIVIGLALAYFTHRKDMPLSLRSIFYPLIGKRVEGTIGNLIDTFAVLGTLFGLATSLGFGVMQVNAGLHYAGILDLSLQNQVILIACITGAATISVVSGLERGILYLSNINIVLGFLLLLFVFFTGPTLFLLKSWVQSMGDYAAQFVHLTYWTAAYKSETPQWHDWQKNWTLFYWSWWIAWSPFVGMFIARISRGRTIREFILGVSLVPSIITFFWLTVFGNTAIYFDLFGGGADQIADAVTDPQKLPTALYMLLDKLPLASITAILATIVITGYFVTSSDSGSLVVDMITAGGHHEPPIKQRIFWAVMEGVVAAVLLITGGASADGLVALQTAALTTALPLSIILILTCWGLVKALRSDPGRARKFLPPAELDAQEKANAKKARVNA